ncbi:hypothetical protein Dda_5711 [Drechslerella dactyloides]|uniref:Uncharacterized protein n=1 Tax=Drechslerella dactyloides TaxID=74499 RepID=A0AAD6NJ46_DREDA|nr:hypothetical protein Dda_5711 [Drechslerella dactyloides]
MRFSAITLTISTLAAAVAAQQTVWVTATVVGTDCAPRTLPTTVPLNTTKTAYTLSIPTTLSTTPVNINIGSNATTTTGGGPGSPPSASASQTLIIGGAGAVSPASGFALAGVLAAVMAIVA